ncbi:MAG: hypothetical protein ACREEL_00050 [Stellaceae bacterium]
MSRKSNHRRKRSSVDLAAIEHKSAFSRAEFCARNSICIATLNNWLRDGYGPRVMRIGGRVMVSREAEADWKRALEQGAIGVPRRGRPRKIAATAHAAA